jgi:tetratricopeptide (TPR) repeat protein
MFRGLYLSLFLLMFLLPGSALAQDVGKVIGEIRVTRGGSPPHAIMVELQLRGATINSAYTDTQGTFGFYGLQSNGYHVIVNDDDYYPVDVLANLNLAESSFAMVQIQLRPREKKNGDPLAKQTAGSNPYIVDPEDYNKRFPKKAVKEYEKGVEAEKKGDKDAAIERYQSALKIAPEYYPAHNNLGTLYLSKSDLTAAELQFREAVRLDQNEAQAYFNLAHVFMLTDRFPEAETTLAAGLQRRPDSAFGHLLQGHLYARTGRLTEAERSLQSAIRLDSKMPDAYLQLVSLYLRQNRRQDAITELQAFLQGFPGSPSAPRAKEVLNKLQNEESAAKR